ncbi:uncharacterized protein CLUP02_00445 [Colletotrichum lupini]|uniref:Uncharacterized protein n=1 Tax=Colletotrichum lupini TaxID=145971 RepID=A0A9Q8SB34_9PEZI|nr:uncharacterized protein CLUP02_00445 [Colletotrichum lupini]UQC73798.1 hypothetical protein CLUP02_00445 [Colletotrichum lupini]
MYEVCDIFCGWEINQPPSAASVLKLSQSPYGSSSVIFSIFVMQEEEHASISNKLNN